ncbi:hypothetical protein DFS34DRAFT_645115 [Phlyctochytrium arcticum]|nr:hypothetical protein DFS34DRAFT_645115 [Phlyctochytrium arcticum]
MANIVTALGPGSKLASLSGFAQPYQAVSKNFSDLLVYPFLENIKVYQDPNGKATGTKDLRSLAVDGSSRFASLVSQDIALARQTTSYAATLQPLIEAVDIATYVVSLSEVVKNYADSARGDSEQSATFFTQFSSYVDVVSGQIDAMADQLASIDDQIASQSDQLQSKDIGDSLYEIFKASIHPFSVFNLDPHPANALVQIAALLQITVDTIKGKFSSLFVDKARLKKVLDGLKTMRTQISSLKALFSSLRANLRVVIDSSSALLGVWDDVTTRLQSVAGMTRHATAGEIQVLVAQWNKVSNDAQAYVLAVTASPSSSVALRAAKALSETPKVPIGQHEIKLQQLLSHSDPKRQLQARLRANPHFSQQFACEQMKRVHLMAAPAADSDEQILSNVISPPDDAKKKLDELATNTGEILHQFDQLLQIPYLNQLACTDPDDGTTPTDIRAMVTKFRERYLNLQMETIPVARDLQTYATTQIAVLPTVSPTATTDPGKISLKDFLDINKGLTSEYQAKATDLFNKRFVATIRHGPSLTFADSLTYQKSWDNAINAVTKAVNECTTNIDAWNKSVDEMTDQMKKNTLYGALFIVGALACFAAAAFFPGALLGAGALIWMAVDQLQKANRLSEAINELKSRIAVATDARAKLNNVLPFMQKIATSLTNVTSIWSTIVTCLTNVSAFYTVLSTPSGPVLWKILEPKVSSNWQAVESSCAAYIQVVAS